MPVPYHLVLASTSPRRREFLTLLGLPFTAVSPGVDGEIDETPLPNEPADQLVKRLSRVKAQAVAENLASLPSIAGLIETHHLIIIAADTEVVLDNAILGKPASAAEAILMLKSLRGRQHDVYSGLTLIHRSPIISSESNQPIATYLHRSQVWMRPYIDAEIAAYVAGGSPLDKAGAYGIQDQPFAPVERLDGCFASVMGLPLAQLAEGLHHTGLSLPEVSLLCSSHTGVTCCQAPANHQSIQQ
ncbi:MAG: septum formation protein Maf [Anaerolineae bacterium]|nr:septum formation protein Maf [Anaerolineae bacterium]